MNKFRNVKNNRNVIDTSKFSNRSNLELELSTLYRVDVSILFERSRQF